METTQKELKGIGGWLIFLAFSLTISVIYNSINLFTSIPLMLELSVTVPMFVFFMIDTLWLCYLAYIAFLFFNKDYRFPKQFKISTIVSIAIAAASLFTLSVSSDYTVYSSDYQNIFNSIFYAIVWILYINKSIRVKNTFIENN